MSKTEHLTVIEGGDAGAVGSSKWATRTRQAAKDLAGRLDTDYIELARLLYQIYDVPVDGDEKNGPIWTQWEYKSFNEYVENELGIHRKRAQRLRRIWWHLEVNLKDKIDDVTKKRLISLGFSKVRELVRVVNARNAEQWVSKAEELSYPHLAKVIADALEAVNKRDRAARETTRDESFSEDSEEPQELTGESEGSGEVSLSEDGVPDVDAPDASADDMKRLNFMAYNDQADTINDALEAASRISGSSIKTNNLYMICMDFLATNDTSKSQTLQQKKRWAARMEEALGLKIVLFDGKDAVYGLSTLKSAAEAE